VRVCRLMTQRAHLCLLMPQLWCSHHHPAKSSSKTRYTQQSFLTPVTTISKYTLQHWYGMLVCAVDVPARVLVSIKCHSGFTLLQQNIHVDGTGQMGHSIATIHVACSRAGVKGSCIRLNRHRISNVKYMHSKLTTENPSWSCICASHTFDQPIRLDTSANNMVVCARTCRPDWQGRRG